METDETRPAILYRIVMDDFVCPYGTRAKLFPERRGYLVEDHHLTDQAQVERFKEEHGARVFAP